MGHICTTHDTFQFMLDVSEIWYFHIYCMTLATAMSTYGFLYRQ
jgi:hypothetical protein